MLWHKVSTTNSPTHLYHYKLMGDSPTVDYNQRGHPSKILPKESTAVQTLDRTRAT